MDRDTITMELFRQILNMFYDNDIQSVVDKVKSVREQLFTFTPEGRVFDTGVAKAIKDSAAVNPAPTVYIQN